MPEEDFDDQIDHEPIYYKQICILRRLVPSMTVKELSRLTAGEANSFINSIQKKQIVSSYEWLNSLKARKRWEAKDRKVQVSAFSSTTTQQVSASTVEVHVRKVLIEISS